jgi:phenazine biosynthesis protein phzE
MDELFPNFNFLQPFAIVSKKERVTILQGEVLELESTKEIANLAARLKQNIFFTLPFAAIAERGFTALGDEKVLGMIIEKSLELSLDEFKRLIPLSPLHLEEGIVSDISDEEFATLVKRIQGQEIGHGEVSQVVLSRTFTGKIADFSLSTIFAIYRALLEAPGSYLTFAFKCRNDTKESAPSTKSIPYLLTGATPERHLSVENDRTMMIPIAGTFRHTECNDTEDFFNFLESEKEINELLQVVDEELKVMGRLCESGGMVLGPFLREAGSVIHTEYHLLGDRVSNSVDALRNSLHAPTVVGSPIASACRVVAKYEKRSRGYYGGEVGIYKTSSVDSASCDLDCAILLRSASIDKEGNFKVQAGAGIVEFSDAESEANETRAKALGFLSIFSEANKGAAKEDRFLTEKITNRALPLLEKRNTLLSNFWMELYGDPSLNNKLKASVCIINNEDDFAFMLGHMLQKFGCKVRVVDTFDFQMENLNDELLLIGPGPGDPTDMNNKRMKRLQEIIGEARSKVATLGVCLGHQALAVALGIPVKRQLNSTQGIQRHVEVFGGEYTLGFYNSFSPCFSKELNRPDIRFDIDYSNVKDEEGEGRIIAMQGSWFFGVQFHPESIMSKDGPKLLYRIMATLENNQALLKR